MYDISRNYNPANLTKATKIYNQLCEMAENNEINKSIIIQHENYTYILNLNDNVLEYANDNEKTCIPQERFIRILSQFDDITRNYFLTQAENSVNEFKSGIINDVNKYLESCDYIEVDIKEVNNEEIGRQVLKDTIRNEKLPEKLKNNSIKEEKTIQIDNLSKKIEKYKIELEQEPIQNKNIKTDLVK